MWIVMTSAAKMPSSCWGRYRRVALVLLDQYYTSHNLQPAMISKRAKGVVRVVDFGKCHVGKTPRAEYQRKLAEAEHRAYELNNQETVPDYSTWGGSA